MVMHFTPQTLHTEHIPSADSVCIHRHGRRAFDTSCQFKLNTKVWAIKHLSLTVSKCLSTMKCQRSGKIVHLQPNKKIDFHFHLRNVLASAKI